MKTRGDILFIPTDQPLLLQPSQRHRLALTHSTDVSAHALFLVGAGGGFLSPETLVPLLALPGKLHWRADIRERHTSQWGETLYALLLLMSQERHWRRDSASDSS